MSLDKLGTQTLQQEGDLTSNQVFDKKAYELLKEMRSELKLIRMALCELSDLQVDFKDINTHEDG